jgi:hypothetical protein
MGQGLVPWLQRGVRQFMSGEPERPMSAGFDRYVAGVADAEARLRTRLGGLTIPPAIRDALLTQVQMLVGEAEITAARSMTMLEHRALEAAMTMRDACDRLPAEVSERETLAADCERLLLDLVRPPDPTR